MKYEESEKLELKECFTDEVKKEIIAFLNSYLGETIYIGISDAGEIKKINEEEKDETESKIINWIKDESIYPNCSKFVSFIYNKDNILEINVSPGTEKPYYLKDKGPKPSGVYIRYGRNKCQASRDEIVRLILESSTTPYEMLPSLDQDLTFNVLKLKLEEKGIPFNKFKMITAGFIINDEYTNLAYFLVINTIWKQKLVFILASIGQHLKQLNHLVVQSSIKSIKQLIILNYVMNEKSL